MNIHQERVQRTKREAHVHPFNMRVVIWELIVRFDKNRHPGK